MNILILFFLFSGTKDGLDFLRLIAVQSLSILILLITHMIGKYTH